MSKLKVGDLVIINPPVGGWPDGLFKDETGEIIETTKIPREKGTWETIFRVYIPSRDITITAINEKELIKATPEKYPELFI